jgi:hypothetical protein
VLFPLKFSRHFDEEAERNCLAHCLVSGWRRMQMIAAVKSRQQTIGLRRILHDLVEIDEGIEVSGGADPFIHGLAVGFAG